MSAIPAVGSWYRRDVTGMRSIAIIPVVAYHAGASFIPGGFIGVDIFYVISGFLITTLLVQELERSGTIRLANFWAKRIRRLVPALVVAIVITLPIAALLSPVFGWDILATQAVASVFYVANILFWGASTDYFDTRGGQSPFLHMWSLGVEEQFYVLWPILVIVAVSVTRRWVPLRWALGGVFGVVFIASLILSIWLTPVDPNAAFYLLPTRAWEFAGAGLIALLPIARLVFSRLAASMLTGVGLTILTFGFIAVSENDLYPGHLALIPFVGTLLLIVGGAGPRSMLVPVLESKPAVWIGNVSYSWYLWHWPLIMFAAEISPGSAVALFAAAMLSLGAAALSYKFIEQPVRYNLYLANSTRRTFVVGGCATVAVGVLAAVVFVSGAALLRTEPFKTYAHVAETLPANGCADGTVVSYDSDVACVLGDPNGATTIAMIGDSHAGHWRAAMDRAAKESGYRLIFRWLSSCPSFAVKIGDHKGVQDPDCVAFRAYTMRILAAARPDAVIISNAYGYYGKVLSPSGARIPLEQQREEWRRTLAEQIHTLEAMGADVAVIRDNPRMLFNPTACLSRLGNVPNDCDSTAEDAQEIIRDLGAVSDGVFAQGSVRATLSVDDEICLNDICSAVSLDGVPVYQDQTHLSAMWTLSQVPRLVSFLKEVVAYRDPTSGR